MGAVTCRDGRQWVIKNPTGLQFPWKGDTSLPPNPRLEPRRTKPHGMPPSFSAPQRPAPTKLTPTGPTDPPTIAPVVSHGIARPRPRSPAAQVAVFKSDIAAYTTSAALGIVSSRVPSASLTGRPMPNRPTETGGGRTCAVLGDSSTGTTVSTSIRQRSPKKWSNKRPPPKPNLAENCHAAHGGGDRQVLPALFGSTAEETFQGKSGQRRSAANFSPAQIRQHKQEAAITHGIRGGRRDHQESPLPVISRGKGSILFGSTAEENFQGKTGQRGSAANFLPAQECQHKKETAIAHGVRGGKRNHQESPFPVISRGKGAILFSLPPDQDCDNKTSSWQKTAIRQ
jgi:hypothetical protein